MKKLSKSKFRNGLECPNKLYFLSKGSTYFNKKIEDPFLESLAQGGFQVEELARLHYPEGVLLLWAAFLAQVQVSEEQILQFHGSTLVLRLEALPVETL